MSSTYQQDVKLAEKFFKRHPKPIGYDCNQIWYSPNRGFCGAAVPHVVAILEKWLRERLRDGGKNKIDVMDGPDGVRVQLFHKNELVFVVDGDSDLDALIKSYEQYKDLVK